MFRSLTDGCFGSGNLRLGHFVPDSYFRYRIHLDYYYRAPVKKRVCVLSATSYHTWVQQVLQKKKQSVEYSIAATESADKGKVQGLQQAGLKDQEFTFFVWFHWTWTTQRLLTLNMLNSRMQSRLWTPCRPMPALWSRSAGIGSVVKHGARWKQWNPSYIELAWR